MYDALSTAELAVLQDMLYTATEKAYRLTGLTAGRAGRLDYRPVHVELARLFLGAGEELLGRLDDARQTTAA